MVVLFVAGQFRTLGRMTARDAGSAASSSYSTGGGGVLLEHRYGAVLLASLLTQDPVQELGDDTAPLTVRFQASAVSAVDDLLISGRTPDGDTRKAVIAVRRSPRLIPSDEKSIKLIGSFLKVVSESWDEITRGRWRSILAAVTSSNAVSQAGELAEIARAKPNEAAFRREIAQGVHARALRDRLANLDAVVAKAVEEGNGSWGLDVGELTWRLLFSLRVRGLRLEGADFTDRTFTVTRLRAATADHTPAAADALFSKLCELAGRYASDGASVDDEKLRRDLSGTPLTLSRRHAREEPVLGKYVQDLPGPLELGVHKAVSTGDVKLPVLPEYVLRDHDRQLRAIIEAADEASAMIALVGDSSTGKTRALWQSLHYLPGQWRVWSPAGAETLKDGLASSRVGQRTVVWLDDIHDYLNPAFPLAGDIAERLIGLLSDRTAGPVLVAATLWPEDWQKLTAQPREERASAGGSARIPVLLDSATRIQVPPVFGTDDLAAARGVAEHDLRLAVALESATGGKITQYLAGAPRLLERYQTARPEAKALIEVAVDARRFGHANQLPGRLLIEAAPGYIDPEIWDQLNDDWHIGALDALTQDWRGLPGPLTRIRARPGETRARGPEYKLADILEQSIGRDRRYVASPGEFWAAAARHAHAEDLARIGNAAQERSRFRAAARIYFKAAATDDAWALHELALMREGAGDHSGAEQSAAKAAVAGNCDALKILAMYRQQAGDAATEERLYQLAVEAGDDEVIPFLPVMRERAGDHADAERLALQAARHGDTDGLASIVGMRAKARGFQDAERLARVALEMGDTHPLTEVASYLDSAGMDGEAERLYRLANAHGSDYALGLLIKRRENAGDHHSANHLAQEAARTGRSSGLRLLADIRLGLDMSDSYMVRHKPLLAAEVSRRLSTPSMASPRQLYQQAAAMDDGQALGILARVQARKGDLDQAIRLAICAAQAGNAQPLRELAEARANAGDRMQAEQLARTAADAGDADALNVIARLREAAGDHAEADKLAITAALADEEWALNDIVRKREEAGDREAAERLALDAASATHTEDFKSFTLIRQPVSGLRKLVGMRLHAHDHTGAEQLAVKAACAGHMFGLTRLAEHRRREHSFEHARMLYELAADYGDADALNDLAAMLKDLGELSDAGHIYQRAINAGSRAALKGLARWWKETGDPDSARSCLRYGLDADGQAASAWTFTDING